MSFFLDLIILLIFALMVFIGYRNGFIKSILNTFSTLISLGIAYIFSKPVSSYLLEHVYREKIAAKVSDAFDGILNTGRETLRMEQLFDDAPEGFRNILNTLGISIDSLRARFAPAIESGSESLKEDMVDYISGPIAQVISDVIAFLLLFVISVILLSIVCSFLDLVCHLPVLKQLNSFFGLLFGVVTGFLTVWTISTALAYLFPVLAHIYPETILPNVIDNTLFVRLLADTNLIRLITGVTQYIES